jgi:predicted acetyltransferase
MRRIRDYAFHGKFDEAATRENIDKGKYDSDDNWGAVDEDGVLLSTMRAIPYEIWFDGTVVPMTGIASVASAPEHRRGGHVRNTFAALFEDMRERGVVFSHLYPFSYAYYRQFGYESIGARTGYTLPAPKAGKFRGKGRAGEYRSGSTTGGGSAPDIRSALVDIYETYAAPYNNMIKRSPAQWDDVLKTDETKNERVYYWQNSKSVIRAWVKLAWKPAESILQVQQYAWDGDEGLLGFMDILSAYDGNAKTVELPAPDDFTPDLFWADIYDTKVSLRGMGMNRIVDAARGLELLKKPGTANRVIIKVNDGFAPWNNKTFELTYDRSGSQVRECSHQPDLEVNERALLQLLIGYKGLDAVRLRGDVVVNSNIDALRELFPAKRINIADHF